VVTTIALMVAYGAAIARISDMAQLFRHNAVLLRVIAVRERGEAAVLDALRREPSFHPFSGANFMIVYVVVAAAAAALTTAVVPMSTGSFWTEQGALFCLKLLLFPVVVGVTFEILDALAALHRAKSSRAALRVLFWAQRFFVAAPTSAELELGVIAANTLARLEHADERGGSPYRAEWVGLRATPRV
jgi:uncharacterized protein YqhQ